MPDLPERFDYQTVLEAVEQPGFDELRHRAGRRNRRTALVAGGLVVLAVLAATWVPTLLRPTPTPPVATTAPKAWPSPTGAKLLGPWFQFADARHGYAIYSGISRRSDKTCTFGIRETTDSGRTWSEMRGVPCQVRDSRSGPAHDLPRREVLSPGLRVVGGDTLLQRFWNHKTYISFDAGRTWSVHRPRTRTADSFPDGVRPYRACPGGEEECVRDSRLEWWDPATGDLMRLTNGPDMGDLRRRAFGTDGSFWVAGYAEDGRWAAAVTRDNGRTWTTRVMDVKPVSSGNAVVATYDGRLGYLVGSGETRHRYSVFRTEDGGATWTRVNTRPTPTKVFDIYEAVVAADGTLLVPGLGGRWFLSRDGGETFTPAEGLPEFDGLRCVPGMCYVGGKMSKDALHWEKIKVE